MYSQQTQNPLISQFQSYVGGSGHVPFQGNNLIRSNPHAQANLNTTMQQYRYATTPLSAATGTVTSHTGTVTSHTGMVTSHTGTVTSHTAPIGSTKSTDNVDILTQMLRPQVISTDNSVVMANLKERELLQKQSEYSKTHMFAYTATPYKPIIKDKPILKAIDTLQVEDLVVHRVDKRIDADVDEFAASVRQKEIEKETHNRELKVEYSDENYSKNKEKFTFHSDCVKRINYESATSQEMKEDHIEFYKRKQKEAEVGQKNCDEILRYLESKDIIDASEMPE
jgi:hypothetical protein